MSIKYSFYIIRVILKMIKEQEKEFINGSMVMSMKYLFNINRVILKMIKEQEKDFING